VQRGQLDRLGHLGPHAGGARRGGLGQPQAGAVADRQELGFGLGACSWRAVQRPGRRGRVVAVIDPRAARRGHLVAGHLGRARGPGMGDHHLPAVPPHVHHLPGQLVRHRVLATFERD